MDMLSFIQINVDRCRAAHDNLAQTTQERQIDIVLVSEPNRALASKSGWYLDSESDACIIVRNRNLKVTSWGKGKGFVWVKIDELFIYACYISPNVRRDIFEKFLQDLEEDVEDDRGAMLLEWTMVNEITISNKGDTPTFQRGASVSFIDITMAGESVSSSVENWEVLDEETFSLHRYIFFTVKYKGKKTVRGAGPLGGGGWMSLIRENAIFNGELVSVENVVAELKEIARNTAVNISTVGGNPVYWWTPELAEEKAMLNAVRRRVQRDRERGTLGPEEMERKYEEYRLLKNAYKKSIKIQKDRCWQKLLKDLDDDIWGEGFQIMRNALKIKPPRVDIGKEKGEKLLEHCSQ
ncbi:uncharacterized protein LOC108913533 [Anoplophora glabripennis]|uniref:uncharacterized protein LOC108913533 n=1 Tax=Anoplophora glabripennis TaxID=217634 RepID=UPI0008759608|nr:uncharacterized protein LOC108913533 [Anoplophora glabripennis]